MKGEVETGVGQTEQTCLLKQVHLERMQIQCAFLISQSLAQLAPLLPQRREWKTELKGLVSQGRVLWAWPLLVVTPLGSGPVLKIHDGRIAKGTTGLREPRANICPPLHLTCCIAPLQHVSSSSLKSGCNHKVFKWISRCRLSCSCSDLSMG